MALNPETELSVADGKYPKPGKPEKNFFDNISRNFFSLDSQQHQYKIKYYVYLCGRSQGPACNR